MPAIDGISAQALSEAIGAVYDCALDPLRWQDALRRIAELCESPSGGMCVHHLKDGQNDRLFEVGYAPDFSRLYDEYAAVSPFTTAGAVAAVGEVMTLQMLCSERELLDSRFYRELLEPYGYLDFIGLVGLRSSGRIASLHMSRTDRSPRYGEREIGLLGLLSPHVCRTLAISDALDVRTLRSDMLEATLDGLAAGVYLTARDGRVIYVNAAAERQVKTGNALRIVNNRLSAVEPAARAALAAAVAAAAGPGAQPEARSVAVPEAGEVGYIATLLPLDQGRRRSVMAPFAASVAIFIQPPAQIPPIPGDAFAKLYGLTGGELRVALTLAQGFGAKDAAELLGVGEPTVRTHLQHIFLKTGTSRQADLIRLLQASSPPIRVA